MEISRRGFIAGMAAGMIMTAEGLWMPGQKLISIPSKKIFIPQGRLAWMEGDTMWMYAKGAGKISIPSYFDFEVRGAEVSKEAVKIIKRHSGLMAQ